MTVSQTSLVFEDLNNFKEYWSGILQNVPQLRVSDVFLMVKLRLSVLRRKTTEEYTNFTTSYPGYTPST